MANLIQIKRSTDTATPPTLANGELAYTSNGNILFIGDEGSILAIAGERVPGTLTANQALVANSTSGIDKVIVANLVPTSVYANGSSGANGTVLTSNGSAVYWGPGTVSGSNTQVQFNDSGFANGSANFTFDKVNGDLSVSNNVLLKYVAGTNGSRNITTNYNTENGTVGIQANLFVGVAGGGSVLIGQTSNNQLVNLSNTTMEVRGGWEANNGALSLFGGSFTDSNYAKIFLQGNTSTATIEANTTVVKTIGGTTLSTTNSTALTISSGLVFSGNGASVTSVNAATVGGNSASDLRTYTEDKAANAYSNAMSDTLSRSGSYTGNNTFGGTNTVFNSNVSIAGTINRDPVITLAGDLTGSVTLTNLANGTLTATIAANSIALGVDTTGDYVANVTAGNGLSGTASGEGSTPTLAVVANNGLASNSTGVFVVANNGLASNSTGVFVVAGTGVTSNATGVHIGQAVGTTDSVTFQDLTTNGNTVLGSGSMDVVSFNASVNTNILPAANATYNFGNNTLRWYQVFAQNVHSEYGYFDKDVTISGNLTVSGNVTTINVSTLSVTDSLIQLASNNTLSDSLDIGFFGSYQTGGGDHEHTGLFRDASDDKYKLFKGLTVSPTTTVDTSNNTYQVATLVSYLESGALSTNSTSITLTANATVNVSITANSLTLSSPLAGTSGGTGLSSVTAEDILVANSTNGFRTLALGTDGYVLQSNGSAVVYATLDGGTF